MKSSSIYILTLSFILASCGGGGGGGGSSGLSPSIPLVSINLSSDLSGQVDVGTEYTFTWSTSNASSCSSSGDWNETVDTSGSHNLTLNEAKAYTFSLSCTNSAVTLHQKTYQSLQIIF